MTITERLWSRLQKVHLGDDNNAMGKPVFGHARGVENQGGTFLGTIGWQCLEDYERARTDNTFRGILGELGTGNKLIDLVVRLERMEV
ncbi:hypothetical protein BJX63DRAFT_429639 [Aspergillus granulosus]|uniref:Uncharacterized protein n=1 Tax=Aspergillus granulosus TaxID=176169 RepID=A0ABR4HQ44_9EURO